MNAVAKYLLRAGLILTAVHSATRCQQTTAEPWAQVQLPVWWGGEADSAAAAWTAARDWCASTTPGGGNGEVRGWRVAGGQGACAGYVIAKSSGATASGKGSDIIAKKKAEALLAQGKLRVKVVALQCLLLPDEGPVAKWVVAVEGLRRLGGFDVRGTLAPGVVIEEVDVPSGRAIIMSISKPQVSDGEIAGLSKVGASRCIAAGLLSLSALANYPLAMLVDQAFELAHDEKILRLAAMRAQKTDDQVVLKKVLDLYGACVFSMKRSDLETWGALCKLGKKTSYLTARVDGLADDSQILERLADVLRAYSLTNLPLLLMTERGPAIFVALDQGMASDFEIRDSLALMGGSTGAVIVPDLVLSVSCDIVTADGLAPCFQNGASVRADVKSGHVLVEPADLLDYRFRRPSCRVLVAGKHAKSRQEALKLAALQRAMQLGLWDRLSAYPLPQVIQDTHAVYAVQRSSGTWEIDLDQSFDEWLRTNSLDTVGAVSFGKMNGLLATLEDDVRKATSEVFALATNPESAGIHIQGIATVKRKEAGVDEDVGLVDKKEWVRNHIEISLTVERLGEENTINQVVQTTKVFGGAKTEKANLAATAFGIKQLAKRLPMAVGELSRSPQALVLTCKQEEIPAGIKSYASSQKNLFLVWVPATTIGKGPDEGVFYMRWPGGVPGLKQALACIAQCSDSLDVARFSVRRSNAGENNNFFK